MFSSRLAVLPSHSTPPESEKHFTLKSKTHFLLYVHKLLGGDIKSNSAVCVSSPGCVVCQCTLWTPRGRSQQSLVSDQSTLSSAPGLHNGTVLNKPFHAESCALGFNQYAYEGQIQILMLLDRALHGGQVHSRESTEYFHYISTFSRIFLNKHHFLDSRAVVCCFLCCVNIQRLIPEDC